MVTWLMKLKWKSKKREPIVVQSWFSFLFFVVILDAFKTHTERIHAHTKHIQTTFKRIQDAYKPKKTHPRKRA